MISEVHLTANVRASDILLPSIRDIQACSAPGLTFNVLRTRKRTTVHDVRGDEVRDVIKLV